MAGTFRDFLSGIASAAPQLSQLVYNYTLYQNEQAFREREMVAQERESEARSKYYEKLGEAQEVETDFNKQTVGLRVRLLELQEKQESIAKGIAQKNLDTFDERYAAELDKLKTDMTVALRGAASQEEAVRINKMLAELQQVGVHHDLFSAYVGMAKNPRDLEIIENLWASSDGDLQQFQNGLLAHDVDMSGLNPAIKQSMIRVAESLNGMFVERRLGLEEEATNTYSMLVDPDKKYDKLRDAYKGVFDPRSTTLPDFKATMLQQYDGIGMAGQLRDMVTSMEKRLGYSYGLLGTMGEDDDPLDPSIGFRLLDRTTRTGGGAIQPSRTQAPSIYAPYGSDPTNTAGDATSSAYERGYFNAPPVAF